MQSSLVTCLKCFVQYYCLLIEVLLKWFPVVLFSNIFCILLYFRSFPCVLCHVTPHSFLHITTTLNSSRREHLCLFFPVFCLNFFLNSSLSFLVFNPHPMICLLILERKRERERGSERETMISCLLHMPQPGIEPTTFWCMGNDPTH